MVLWSWCATAMAQAWEFSCEARPNLAKELEMDSLSLERERLFRSPNEMVFSAATSLLAPPPSTRPKEGGIYEEHEVYGAWTCTYGAPNLVDGDERTAWVEGAPGLGIGEIVVFPMPAPTPLEIRAGYGKSPALYQQNARPRRIEVIVLGQGIEVIHIDPSHMYGMPVLGRHEIELRDVDGWQPLPLPRWGRPRTGWAPGSTPPDPAKQVPTYLAIRILSAYPGTKYEDTCISEVRTAKGP